jgi:hypothetical protein
MSVAQLKASRLIWLRRERYRHNKWLFYRNKSKRPAAERTQLRSKWWTLYEHARRERVRRDREIAASVPLREKALAEVLKLVGVMEVGGNNMGARVLEIIRANGGTGPESWCGDTVAWAYRHAGSKVVQRGWAAVRFLGFLTGMKIVSRATRARRHRLLHLRPHRHLLRRNLSARRDRDRRRQHRPRRRRLGLPHRRRRRLHQAPQRQPRRALRARHPLGAPMTKTIGISPKVYVPAVGQIVVGVVFLLLGLDVEGKTAILILGLDVERRPRPEDRDRRPVRLGTPSPPGFAAPPATTRSHHPADHEAPGAMSAGGFVVQRRCAAWRTGAARPLTAAPGPSASSVPARTRRLSGLTVTATRDRSGEVRRAPRRAPRREPPHASHLTALADCPATPRRRSPWPGRACPGRRRRRARPPRCSRRREGLGSSARVSSARVRRPLGARPVALTAAARVDVPASRRGARDALGRARPRDDVERDREDAEQEGQGGPRPRAEPAVPASAARVIADDRPRRCSRRRERLGADLRCG